MSELLRKIRVAQINMDHFTESVLLKQLDEMERLL